jgi:hypothetical protein
MSVMPQQQAQQQQQHNNNNNNNNNSKGVRNRSGVAQRVPGGLGSQIS